MDKEIPEQRILIFPAEQVSVEGRLVDRTDDADDEFYRARRQKVTVWAKWCRRCLREVREERESEEEEQRSSFAGVPVPDEEYCEGRAKSYRELLEEMGRVRDTI